MSTLMIKDGFFLCVDNEYCSDIQHYCTCQREVFTQPNITQYCIIFPRAHGGIRFAINMLLWDPQPSGKYTMLTVSAELLERNVSHCQSKGPRFPTVSISG